MVPMKLLYSIIILVLTSIFSMCMNKSENSSNWFLIPIFTFETNELDQKITRIYSINRDTVFLLGKDEKKIINKGGSEKDQNAIIFRSTDGGRTLERKTLGKGLLEDITQSADKNSLYLLQSSYSSNREVGSPNNFSILRSFNAGETWEQVYTFENKDIGKVLFYNQQIGFASVLEDPIGHNSPSLYKTTDGGKNWVSTSVNMRDISIIEISSDNKIIAQYLDSDRLSICEIDIPTLEVKEIPLKVSNDLKIFGLIEIDPLTGQKYIMLSKNDRYSYLYNINTEFMTELPDYSYGVNIYGDFIGIMRNKEGSIYNDEYCYSYDKGFVWHYETPIDSNTLGDFNMYGNGCVWMTTVGRGGVSYPLMIRRPINANNN
jgi:hypothetical protein